MATYRSERQMAEGLTEITFLDGSDIQVRRHEYDRLTALLQDRKETYAEVEGFFGDPILLRLDHIARVALATPDGIRAYDQYDAERERHERVIGDD